MASGMNKKLPRRGVLALGLGLSGLSLLGGLPALAAGNVAEAFVDDNIHKGLDILNNKTLSTEQRRVQFEGFLLGLTDMKRIAVFTLGNYRRSASQADQDAFDAAFQN